MTICKEKALLDDFDESASSKNAQLNPNLTEQQQHYPPPLSGSFRSFDFGHLGSSSPNHLSTVARHIENNRWLNAPFDSSNLRAALPSFCGRIFKRAAVRRACCSVSRPSAFFKLIEPLHRVLRSLGGDL